MSFPFLDPFLGKPAGQREGACRSRSPLTLEITAAGVEELNRCSERPLMGLVGGRRAGSCRSVSDAELGY